MTAVIMVKVVTVMAVVVLSFILEVSCILREHYGK